MESRTAASTQQNDEKSVERLMDEYLKANGLHRKRIAKDGSCLFRAVAEQVLHCQGLHNRVRAECVKYLRQKRDVYESFIEGDFEVYLHMLQDPQSWVGQVEISALSVLYKHDFIIYQQPGKQPVNITENGYTDKVLLCFLNGNHYDSVYPISSVKTAAMCQSILYELLYERVYGVDRNVLVPSLKASQDFETQEHESSGNSDLDEGEDFWSRKAAVGVSNRTKGRGRGQARGIGRGCLLGKVQKSLSPTYFRNVEYDVWLLSKQAQQRRDFCMAAGMHYKAGDKCQVRLNNTDRFYSAYIQDVSPEDGPVTVFIEELGEKHIVPLWNLHTPEDSWSTVEKSKKQSASSSSGPTERDTRPGRKPLRSVSHSPTASSGSAPAGNRVQQQHSWPPQDIKEPQSLGKDGPSRKIGQGGVCASSVEGNTLLELLNKDEENFPTLEASAKAASIEGSRRAEKKGSRKKLSADTKEQSVNTVHKADQGKQAKKMSVDQDQRLSPPPTDKPNPTPSTTLPVSSAPKSTKAASASTTAPARVPYKASSSLSAHIPPIQSPSSSVSSTGPLDSSQTPDVQAQTAKVPSKGPPISSQTTPIQSQTGTVASTGPSVSSQTTTVQSQTVLPSSMGLAVSSQITPIQFQNAPTPFKGPPGDLQTTLVQSQTTPSPSTRSPHALHGTPVQSRTTLPPQNSCQASTIQTSTAPVPSTRPIILFGNIPFESETALETPEVSLVDSHTTVDPLPSLPLPATSVSTQITSQCTPTTSIRVPNLSPMMPTSVPQSHTQTIQSQIPDPNTAVTTPVHLNSGPETTTTFLSSQTPRILLSPATNALSSVSAASTFQTTPAPTFAIVQTTSTTPRKGSVHTPCQITSAAEVPGSTDLPPPSKFPVQTVPESNSAGESIMAHVPNSTPSTAQPPPSLASIHPVQFGICPPYPTRAPHSSPNISSTMQDPCAPPAAVPYLYDTTLSSVEGAGGASLSDCPPQLSQTLAQVCQDSLYPGFPRNDKGEFVPSPPFSCDSTGKDLPSDTTVLRFFFNLGLKAYLYPMFPPVAYLAPLTQAYHHIQTAALLPQTTNSRPIFTSSNPSPAVSTPVSHFDVRGVVQTSSPMDVGMFNHHSLPVQVPLPVASHPTLYTGMHPMPPAGPSVQYSAPLLSVGSQNFSALTHHYGIPTPTVPSVLEAGQRSLTPQVEKTFWPGQGQPHSEGRGINTMAVPITVETQHRSGTPAVAGGGVPSQTAEPMMLVNGNRRERSGGFIGSSLEQWDTEKAEFGNVDIKTVRSYHNQSYKSGGRHAQNERAGYRGRGSRGRRENTGWGRQDGHLPYNRGSGGRNRGGASITHE